MTTLHLHSSEKLKRKKAPSIRLTDAERWEVAKYCIENRGVLQGPNGRFTIYRVQQKKLAEEVSGNITKVNVNHVVDSISFYNTVCELTANLPVVPQQESMQEEMLKIEIVRIKNELAKSQDELQKAAVIINNYKERFVQITKLAKV